MEDTFNLQRFIDAQAPVYSHVCAELRQGYKKSHWIWFIFPQIANLGQSHMATQYGISSIHEARAYLQHPLLSARMHECCQLLMNIDGSSIGDIMGYPDDLKLRSSMTLFSEATPEDALFTAVLRKFFGGQRDERTLKLLGL